MQPERVTGRVLFPTRSGGFGSRTNRSPSRPRPNEPVLQSHHEKKARNYVLSGTGIYQDEGIGRDRRGLGHGPPPG